MPLRAPTTECEKQLSYLDILVTIENGKYYMTSETISILILLFSTNIPSGPAYGVYVSQLVRIGRIFSNYTHFVVRQTYSKTCSPRIQVFNIVCSFSKVCQETCMV